jgi:hypothetical protein
MNQLVLDSDVVAVIGKALHKNILSHHDTPTALELIEFLCGRKNLGATWEQAQASIAPCIILIDNDNPTLSTRAAHHLTYLCNTFQEAGKHILHQRKAANIIVGRIKFEPNKNIFC